MKHVMNSLIIVTALLIAGCSGLRLQNYPKEKCLNIPGEKTSGLIDSKCLFCHKGDFATKELICERKNMIIDAVSAGRMPKFRKLSEEDLKTILKWDL